jgi:hypothetical protein
MLAAIGATLMARPVHAAPRPTIVLFDWGPGAAGEATAALREILARTDRFTLRAGAEVLESLRAAPLTARATERAAAAVEEGRGHEIRLDWPAAEASYRKALEVLDEHLVRLHSPEAVARVHVALGAVYVNDARLPAAQDEFRRALALAPHVEPDRGYSPQVRGAFEAARGPRPTPPTSRPVSAPPPPPSPGELARLCDAVRADGVVVVEDDETAGRRVLRGSVYIAARRAYVAVETRALVPGATEVQSDAAALGVRLLEDLEAVFPPPRRPTTQPATQRVVAPPPPPPPPPPRPWYRRWWVWAAVGVVATGSVVLPLVVLRRDTVDLVVRY